MCNALVRVCVSGFGSRLCVFIIINLSNMDTFVWNPLVNYPYDIGVDFHKCYIHLLQHRSEVDMKICGYVCGWIDGWKGIELDG